MTEEEKTKIREFLKCYRRAAGCPLVVGKTMAKILKKAGIYDDYLEYRY